MSAWPPGQTFHSAGAALEDVLGCDEGAVAGDELELERPGELEDAEEAELEDTLDDGLRLEGALDAELCDEPEDDDGPMLDDRLDSELSDELPEDGDCELLSEDSDEPLGCDDMLG